MLQLYRQFVVFRQAVFGLPHHVVIETDGGQIGFDGGSRFPTLLHINDVRSEMLAADVGQLLQVVVVGQEPAEPFTGVVVPPLGLEAPLPVMPRGLIQLGDQGVVNPRFI